MSYKKAFETLVKTVEDFSTWNKEDMKDPNSSEFEDGMDFAYDEILDVIKKIKISLV